MLCGGVKMSPCHDCDAPPPTSPGGPNGESLYDAQRHALRGYPLEVKAFEGHARDPAWRPLRDEELRGGGPLTGHAYFDAAADDGPPYYWLR